MTILESEQVLICPGYDNDIRWQPGDRLEHIFEDRVDQLVGEGRSSHLAVDSDDGSMSYLELEQRANQTARYLRSIGVNPGDRVGLLFNKTADAYVAMLGVLKAGAAYVPFDGSFPRERIGYIVEDADVSAILTVSDFAELVGGLVENVTAIDSDWDMIASHPTERPAASVVGEGRAALSYIIYTSGTTGKPKGVAIEHASICNFVKVAGECYEVNGQDRMYQGMTLAFDFSVEEIWIALAVGATLVPAPQGAPLVGEDLAIYLEQRSVTALACVPTLLATMDKDVPQLRFLLLSGEACPADLAKRWHRPDRRIINAYGPTEATVTATWLVLDENGSVTIGGPLPTYSSVILDPEGPTLLGPGEIGEIGLGGIGLALGYLNRPDLTEAVFIEDFVGLPQNPSQRIYRTGDLGRITDSGEIEFLGRIDTQVKIRGYRIEVTEIESVLLRLPQIAQAVVDPYEPAPGVTELVGFYTVNDGMAPPSNAELADVLKASLPVYMIPSVIQQLDHIPTSTSGKADRAALPVPTGPRLIDESASYLAPQTELEADIASCVAEVLGVERVSVDADFFNDLGAYSLMLAQVCTLMRDRMGDVDVAMTDMYRHRNVVELAAYLDTSDTEGVRRLARPGDHVPTRMAYYRTGLLQGLTAAVSLAITLTIGLRLFVWLAESAGPVQFYVRSVGAGLAVFVLFSAASIAGKWLVIGRFKSEAIPLWSMRHYRFWLARSFVTASPLRLFRGLPIFNLYLRALGAEIGSGVVFNSSSVPICTDLISIGEDSVLRVDSGIRGYCVEGNYILTGRVDIGSRVTIGEGSVLEIETAMGDDSTLAHASSLQSLQRIPRGEHWHGSPAQPGPQPAPDPTPQNLTLRRKLTYSGFALFNRLFLTGPLALVALYFAVSGQGIGRLGFGLGSGFGATIVASSVLFVTGVIVGGFFVMVIPRLLHGFVRPGRSYVLYGFHYSVMLMISGLGNSKFFNHLFGDSAFITRYQQMLGWNLGKVEQTGSNFGILTRQDSALLSDIGSGTMVSDGVHMINTRVSATAIVTDTVRVGEQSFLGNSIQVPFGHTVGDNCLFATKVMVPTDGVVRNDVGLLGSPAFEIPRQTTSEDTVVLRPEDDRSGNTDLVLASSAAAELAERVAAKTRYNLRTIGWFLFTRWVFLTIGLLGTHWSLTVWRTSMTAAVLGLLVLGPLIIALSLALERSVWGFGAMKPRDCTIHDPYYWKVERYWKLVNTPVSKLFAGTPMKNVISRLGGVKVGPMVFDDGALATEKTMVTIGAGAALSQGALLQSHSLEDGEFKSDYVQIGDGATVGNGAFVHYGTNVGARTVIDADSFLMKGETTPADSWWQGNPARLTVEREHDAVLVIGEDGSIVEPSPEPTPSVLPELCPVVVDWSSYDGARQDLEELGLGGQATLAEVSAARRVVSAGLGSGAHSDAHRRRINSAYAALRVHPTWNN